MSARNERRVAVEANVDPRTVRRVVEGRRVQPAIETAVREAMRKCEADGSRVALPAGTVLRERTPEDASPDPPPIPIAEAFRLGMHITPDPIHEPDRKPRT